MSLDTDTFIDLIGEAMRKEFEDKLWEKWLHDDTDMNWEEYLKRHTNPTKKKTEEEILKDAENILKSMSATKAGETDASTI